MKKCHGDAHPPPHTHTTLTRRPFNREFVCLASKKHTKTLKTKWNNSTETSQNHHKMHPETIPKCSPKPLKMMSRDALGRGSWKSSDFDGFLKDFGRPLASILAIEIDKKTVSCSTSFWQPLFIEFGHELTRFLKHFAISVACSFRNRDVLDFWRTSDAICYLFCYIM